MDIHLVCVLVEGEKMLIKNEYASPLGKIEIVADENSVKGVWFENQKYYGSKYDLATIAKKENKVIRQVWNWLDDYFSGEKPKIDKALLKPEGTVFQKKVFEILSEIPYGKTITYKEIANMLADKEAGKKFFARAVGGAVGHNPIAILIPCHRVVGSDGSLTGYAGGIEKKIELLTLEGIDL